LARSVLQPKSSNCTAFLLENWTVGVEGSSGLLGIVSDSE